MSEPQPDFYLGSTETTPPIEPRKCFILQRLRAEWGNNLLLVRLEPPIIQDPRWHGPPPELMEVVLQARLQTTDIDPVTNWPLHVYVGKIVHEKIKDSGVVSRDDVRLEYWGEIYPTLEEAEKWIAPHR